MLAEALSAKQLAYLKACAAGPQSPWDAGSTTVSRLRRAGLIVAIQGRYVATAAGEVIALTAPPSQARSVDVRRDAPAVCECLRERAQCECARLFGIGR